MNAAQLRRDVRRYLATGESDPMGMAGAGSISEGLSRYDDALRAALIAQVERRERGGTAPALPLGFDATTLAAERLTPMVVGLFPAAERPAVLRLLSGAIVFLTPAATRQVLADADLHTAWKIANMYLHSIGAGDLGREKIDAVGMSEDMVCYVSLHYFTRQERFADWVVHEAAHVFHDQKRRYLGLPYTRHRERLLEIDFCKRETFAYGCEFYSHMAAHARSRREREVLLGEWRQSGPWGSRQQVDWAELQDIVAEAVDARNGWKRILARCAPPPRRPMREFIQECVREALAKAAARGEQ